MKKGCLTIKHTRDMENIRWFRDDVSLGGNSKGEIRPCLSIRMDKTVLSFQISFFFDQDFCCSVADRRSCKS